MDIGKETVNEFKHGHKAVGTTAVPMTILGFTALKGILLRCPGSADPDPNTAPVWVGGAGVSADNSEATGGLPILPGSTLFIPLDNPTQLYFVSTAGGQDIAWIIV